jgi:hypothetical protein
MSEVDALGFAKHGEKLMNVARGSRTEEFVGASGDTRDIRMLFDPGEFLSYSLWRQNEIDTTGFDGAAGHAGVLGGCFILGKSDAADGFYGEATRSAIGGRARQNYGDGAVAAVLG